MCGRYTLTTSKEKLVEEFDLSGELPELPPSYNIAPTQDVATILGDGEARRLELMRWGLIPSWADDPGIGSRMINARSETAAEKPSFRAAFKKRRCLIPADGFYEWQKTNGAKQPFHIRLQDERPFALAGLWEIWRDEGGPEVHSCTILTTEANDLLVPHSQPYADDTGPRKLRLLARPRRTGKGAAHRATAALLFRGYGSLSSESLRKQSLE